MGLNLRLRQTLEQQRRVLCRQPAAVFRYAEFYNGVPAAIDGFDNGAGGAEGDLVFAGLAAKQDADTELFLRGVGCHRSGGRLLEGLHATPVSDICGYLGRASLLEVLREVRGSSIKLQLDLVRGQAATKGSWIAGNIEGNRLAK